MNTSRDAGGARCLEGRYYTSPHVYLQETERIFRTSWLCLGRQPALADRGAYQSYDIEGESLLLLRDRQESLRAYYNVCRHRGSQLCRQPSGTFSGGIRCPYHGWTYDLDGRMLAAPHMRDVPGFDQADHALAAVSVAVWEGFVFVNLGRDPVPLEAALAPLWKRFDGWSVGALQVVRELHYEVAANWKLLFQNYSECYHCPGVHPALNHLTPFRSASNDLVSGPYLGGPMQLADGVQSLSSDGSACGRRLPGLRDEQSRQVAYYTLFPTLLLSLHPDYVMVHYLRRIDAARTHVTCQFLFHPQAVADAGFDPQPAVAFWDQTNRQDWDVCELSQRGVASRSFRPGPYGDLEGMVAAFDRHYLQALAAGEGPRTT